MNTWLERLMGVDTLTDQVISMDLLMSAKTGIQLYAVAATEAATPELRAVFVNQLHEAIEAHADVTAYMIDRGFYHAYNVPEQARLDYSTVQTAISLPS